MLVFIVQAQEFLLINNIAKAVSGKKHSADLADFIHWVMVVTDIQGFVRAIMQFLMFQFAIKQTVVLVLAAAQQDLVQF